MEKSISNEDEKNIEELQPIELDKNPNYQVNSSYCNC